MSTFKAKTFRLTKSTQYADQLWLKSLSTIATPSTEGQTDSVRAAYLPGGDTAVPTVFGTLSWKAPNEGNPGQCAINVSDGYDLVAGVTIEPSLASFNGDCRVAGTMRASTVEGGTMRASTVEGTLTTAYQPNITRLGPLSDLTVNGTVILPSLPYISSGKVLSMDSATGEIGYTNITGGLIDDGSPTVLMNVFTLQTPYLVYYDPETEAVCKYPAPFSTTLTDDDAIDSVTFNANMTVNGSMVLPSLSYLSSGKVLTVDDSTGEIGYIPFTGAENTSDTKSIFTVTEDLRLPNAPTFRTQFGLCIEPMTGSVTKAETPYAVTTVNDAIDSVAFSANVFTNNLNVGGDLFLPSLSPSVEDGTVLTVNLLTGKIGYKLVSGSNYSGDTMPYLTVTEDFSLPNAPTLRTPFALYINPTTGSISKAENPYTVSTVDGVIDSVTFGSTVVAPTLSATNLEGTLISGTQPNITSLGTLSDLTVDGSVFLPSVPYLPSAGTALTVDPATGQLMYTDIMTGPPEIDTVPLLTITEDLRLPNAPTSRTSYSLYVEPETGSVTKAETPYTVSTVDGVIDSVTFGSTVVAPTLSATNLEGTLISGTQPNITSIGTLSSLNVSGNVVAGNLVGTIRTGAQPFITSVGTLSGLTVAGNTVINSLTVSNTVTATSLRGNVTTAAQPNITSLGTLTSLNVRGNITAGNISTNVITATAISGTLTSSAQPNITSIGTLSSLGVSGNLNTGNLVSTGTVEAAGYLKMGTGSDVWRLRPDPDTGSLAVEKLEGSIWVAKSLIGSV